MHCESCRYPISEDTYNENNGLCLACWEVDVSGSRPLDEEPQALGCTPEDSCVPYMERHWVSETE